jgi:acyl-CoA reductase-like NAD-dependent aldehyde dehydrogenase
LEHGGAAPVIIEKDADINDAIPLLAKGGFYHAGQVCVSVQRVFVHKDIIDEVAEKLVQVAKVMTVGDPVLESTDIGPLIRHVETERIVSWVEQAIEAGAKCLCGGKAIMDSCFEATVLLNPPVDADVSQKEIFGPVICLYAFDDRDEAIRQANALPYSFQAAVFTKNIDNALYSYKHLNASAVMVNDFTAFRTDWMPFAGLKESGLGVGGIPFTMHDMQIDKMLLIKSNSL